MIKNENELKLVLYAAAASENVTKLQKILYKQEYEHLITDTILERLLRWGINKENKNMVHSILLMECDIQVVNKSFILCIVKENLELIKMFIDFGADVHYRDDSALRWAAYLGNLDIIKYLISQGANVKSNNNESLFWIIDNEIKYPTVNLLKFIRIFLDLGADINVIPNYHLEQNLEFYISYLREHWNLYIRSDSVLYNYSQALKYRVKFPLYITSINWLYRPNGNFMKKKMLEMDDYFYKTEI